ncbi:MAG: ribonuclease E, partial [Enterobacteriaceae bacterium]
FEPAEVPTDVPQTESVSEVALPATVVVSRESEILESHSPGQPVPEVEKEILVQGHKYAAAPMTRAPAPEDTPVVPVISHWQRPDSTFTGRGAAGAHIASNQSSAPAGKPAE